MRCCAAMEKLTPRKLFKGVVEKDANSGNELVSKMNDIRKEETKNLIKGFVSVERKLHAEHQKLLANPTFQGFHPQLIDSVFRLGRYAIDGIRLQTSTGSKSSTDSISNKNLHNSMSLSRSASGSPHSSSTRRNLAALKTSVQNIDTSPKGRELTRTFRRKPSSTVISTATDSDGEDELQRSYAYTLFEWVLVYINVVIFFGICVTLALAILFILYINSTIIKSTKF